MADGDRTAVKSADRVLDVLELVSAGRRGLSHTEIGSALGIPKSSLTPLLRNLADRRYLQLHGETRRFTIGPAATALGDQRAGNAFPELAGKVLPALTHATGESSGAYVFDGLEVERVAGHNSDQALLYVMRVHDRFPAHAISAGKAILAYWSEAALAKYFSRMPPAQITPTTLDEQALRAEFPEIRASGIAYSREECTSGIIGLAAPVLGHGGVAVGGVAVCLPTSRFDERADQRIKAALQRARRDLEADLNSTNI